MGLLGLRAPRRRHENSPTLIGGDDLDLPGLATAPASKPSMDRLPEELLADILGRLPPRPLAVCRCVCKDLRTVIDGRGLLLALAHLVPRGLSGMFINCDEWQDSPYFFARRAAPRIDAELSFLPQHLRWQQAALVHQCNGLLLFQDRKDLHVCNPATRRWEQLPPPPKDGGKAVYLVFDPTVSLHYDVFLLLEVPPKPRMPVQGRKTNGDLPSSSRAQFDREVHIKGLIQWTPSSYVAQVFSSRTSQWQERAYAREDDVAVTLSDVWSDHHPLSLTYRAPQYNAVCWRGAFYLHCRGGFIMRFSLLEQKYRVIKIPRLKNDFMPPRLEVGDFFKEGRAYQNKRILRRLQRQQEYLDSLQPSMHLGKSKHGIYYTALRWHQLQVWVLQDATSEWELKYKSDIMPSFLQHYKQGDRKEIKASWILDNHGQIEIGSEDRQDYGWDSSDDSSINVEEEYGDMDGRGWNLVALSEKKMSSMDFLGYHPSKEINFLGNHFSGFAYFLGSSKLQYLGTLNPVECCQRQVESFIYTPCMDDMLPTYITNSNDGGVEEEEDMMEDVCLVENEGFKFWDIDLEVEDEDFEFCG